MKRLRSAQTDLTVAAACKRAYLRNQLDEEGEPTVDAEVGALLDAQTDAAIRRIAVVLGAFST